MPNQQQIKHNNFHPALRILFVFLLSFYLISLTQMDLAGITDEQIVEAVLQTLEGIRGKAELFDIPTNNLQAVPTGGSELTSGRSLRTVQDQSTATSDEPGWFYNFITLNSQTCSPTPTAVSGVTTNQCVRNQDDTSRSVYVTCNSDSCKLIDNLFSLFCFPLSSKGILLFFT